MDCRARRSGWVGSTALISSGTALLNCAEVETTRKSNSNELPILSTLSENI